MNKLTANVAVGTGAPRSHGARVVKALAAASASVAVFLASDGSAWMTGEPPVASGGLR